MNREEMMEDAALEGETNVVVDQLSGESEIGLEQLRQLPGTEGLDDAALQSMWDEVRKEGGNTAPVTKGQAEAVADATGGEAVKTARGWKVYGADGKEVSDLSKMTAEQFLQSKLGYNANKTEQRRNIDELIRVAQFGHMNESKLARTAAERNQFYQEVQALKPQLESMSKVNNAVKYAITQFSIGNDKPLEGLIEAFKRNMGGENFANASVAEAAPSDATEAAGLRIWHEEIQPQVDKVADTYGASHIVKEVRSAVQKFIDTEPNLTREKLDSYINEEIPLLLQESGYRSGEAAKPVAAAVAEPNKEIEELKKQVAALTAGKKNEIVETVRTRMRKLPGSGRGDVADAVTVTDDENIPASATKSKDAFRKMLRS